MSAEAIKSGVVHRVPKDIKDMLLAKSDVLNLWNNLTPLSRNEWICYITIVKKSRDLKKTHNSSM